jgi:hypothetical protein
MFYGLLCFVRLLKERMRAVNVDNLGSVNFISLKHFYYVKVRKRDLRGT